MASEAKHKLARVATGTKVVTGSARLYGILLVGGSAATTVKIFDTVDGSGTETVGAATAIGTSVFIDFEELGPVMFSSYMYVTPAGTGGVAYVWYD